MLTKADCSAIGLAAAVLAFVPTYQGARAQDVQLEPGRLDLSEFAALPGADFLDPTRIESGEGVDLPVRMPVLGLGDRLNEAFIGREAGEGLDDTFVYDADEGYWYSQEVTLSSGVVYIKGERRALVDQFPTGSDEANPATLQDPQILFIGDDPVGAAAGDESPAEVMASFELGGALYRVTLVCHVGSRSACEDDTEIRWFLRSLEILGGGTLQ